MHFGANHRHRTQRHPVRQYAAETTRDFIVVVQLGGLEPPTSCSTDIAGAPSMPRQSRLLYKNRSVINEQARRLSPFLLNSAVTSPSELLAIIAS
jgi:hypothetical protein